ncbi:hypothetical protein [Acidovorax sp.]|uniref:hypothetical protein n=1 Tax=Acidovorax sp. TaxID=1872122 RepID=UPI002ACEFDB6|nr:hypothetical protein [Acidovorax sp.]MDZ7863404.1 hypothetical protein [Acidovorax sp.]
MAKQSAIYSFTRDERVPGVWQNRASTDAVGVVLNWAASPGRTYQTMLDQDDCFVAFLSWDDAGTQEAADDLDARLSKKGLKREGITELQVDKLRAE